MAAATFTKLRSGDWGIRATFDVAPGAPVTVARKDGTTTVVTVGRVIWKGDGVVLATIDRDGKAKSSKARRGPWTCYVCGGTSKDPACQRCWECGLPFHGRGHGDGTCGYC
jgi:hypothetical protein